jgi:predicted component of type VI protein secretion system
MPLFAWLALALGLLAVTGRADPNPEIVSLGHETYALTRWANNGFTRNTEKLKTQALEDAAAYCAKLHKELKVLDTTTTKPFVPLTGFAHAKVVFKALDANDPELHAPVPASVPDAAVAASAPAAAPPVAVEPPPRSETDALYRDLMELDELRKRGLLTEEEFQAKRKKLVEKSP